MVENLNHKSRKLNILAVSTPLGFLGSGRGGGIELTLPSIVAGLLSRGHNLTIIAGGDSKLPPDCADATLWTEYGEDQPSWQRCDFKDPVVMPFEGLLQKFWSRALKSQSLFDAIVNFSYDWLPYWLSPHIQTPLFNVVTMGSVSAAMDDVIQSSFLHNPNRIAFFSETQARDFPLVTAPIILGNGLDLQSYVYRESTGDVPFWGWAGRISPEKGLEDAATAASKAGRTLRVWGLICDESYKERVECAVSQGTIDWRGFLVREDFQRELGECEVFLNTPKWNEAYGNVVIEALACGVPVVSYRRGGPTQIIRDGYNGFLSEPDCTESLARAAGRAASEIPRRNCRTWVERFASSKGLIDRTEAWLQRGL